MRLALTFVCLFAITWTGCIFSPAKGKSKVEPPVYEPNRFPESVVRNLIKAYAARDSAEYKSLFDDKYKGTSIDQFDQTPQLLTLTKADEESHIRALARSTVSSILLSPSPRLQRFRDEGDPAGWETIQNPFTLFWIYDQDFRYDIIPQAKGTNFIIFKFISTATSPADTTWKIILFSEIHS